MNFRNCLWKRRWKRILLNTRCIYKQQNLQACTRGFSAHFSLHHEELHTNECETGRGSPENSWFSYVPGKLYNSHLPTTLLQKSLLTVGSAGMSLYDPYRHDMIAVLGETTGYIALRRIRAQMLQSEEGKQILNDKPRINTTTVDMDSLQALPDGTFGKEYHQFMEKNKITSDSRASVHFVDDGELAYVMQRYREVHDFGHLLLGMPTNMLGEVVVKWFETFNTGLPMCALGAVFGPLRLSAKRRRKLFQVYLPEIVPMASKSKLTLNTYFEKRWEQPIEDLRKELGLYVIKKKVK